LRRYFANHGASVIVGRQLVTQSVQDELIEDLIAIGTYFSCRVHSMRGSHGKRVTDSIVKMDPCAQAMDKAVSSAIDAAVDAVVREKLTCSQIQRSSGVQNGREVRIC
jgi:hypothetical protein